MKRKRHSIDIDIEDVTLYLEDLETIHATVREVAQGGEVRVETPDYEYSSLDELRSHEPDAKKVEFIPSDEPIRVTVDQLLGVNIYAYKPEDFRVNEAASHIERLVRSRTRRFRFLRSMPLAYLVSAVALANAVLYFTLDKNDPYRSWTVQVPIDGLIWAFILFKFTVRRRPAFTLQRKAESSTFLSRNRESLIVGAVLAAFSAFVGWLLRGPP